MSRDRSSSRDYSFAQNTLVYNYVSDSTLVLSNKVSEIVNKQIKD